MNLFCHFVWFILFLLFSFSPVSAASLSGITRDYTATSRQLTFEPAGAARQCINITIEDDDILEHDETFNVTLTVDTDSVAVLTPAAVVTILDNDSTCNDTHSHPLYRLLSLTHEIHKPYYFHVFEEKENLWS